MSEAVKERVLKQIVANVTAMNDGDNGFSFAHVERAALDRSQKLKSNTIAVFDATETYTYQTAYLLCSLRIGLEFFYKMKYGEVASTALIGVQSQLQKVIANDPNLVEEGTSAQLAEDIKFVSYEPDIEGVFDGFVSGFLQFDVFYRVNKEDPYQLM